MYIVTLLTDPEEPALSAATVAALRHAWGGGPARWLAPDVAAEFPVEAIPGNRWETWASLQEMRVDLVVQPAEGRRKAMLLADMDSTMIRQECVDELAAEAGVGATVAEITARAMNGELDFEAALRARVGLLKGLDSGVIDTVLAHRISYMPGGAALVATMKANGAYTALVSGGFTAFICWTHQAPHVAPWFGKDAEEGRKGGVDMSKLPEAGAFEYLKTQAVARL